MNRPITADTLRVVNNLQDHIIGYLRADSPVAKAIVLAISRLGALDGAMHYPEVHLLMLEGSVVAAFWHETVARQAILAINDTISSLGHKPEDFSIKTLVIQGPPPEVR